MKKITLISLFLLGCVGLAKAGDILVEAGPLDVYIPLKVVKASQLYDFGDGRGFVGAETTILGTAGKKFETVIGGATSTSDPETFVYAGAQWRLSASFFDVGDNNFYFGGYVGRNFRANENYAGIKASTKLW